MNEGDYSHVLDEIKHFFLLPDSERRLQVEAPFWIKYPRATQILSYLEDLLSLPRKHRMPAYLLLGEANNGKTMLLNKFISKYEATMLEDGSGVNCPIIKVNVPPKVDESKLYDRILQKLNAPYLDSHKPTRKQYQIVQIASRLKVRLIIFDEGSDFDETTPAKQRETMVAIKDLSNELQASLIISGVPKVLNVINSDPQLSSRFEPLELPIWNPGADFQWLLKDFEKNIPLKKPSYIYHKEMSERIYRMTDGTIGNVSRLLGKAARLAIDKNVEQISHDVLDLVEHVPPRRK